MQDREAVEKVRQEIMRFRELLTIMRGNLESGERSYAKLFSRFSAEEMAAGKEKDMQWKAAEAMGPDEISALGGSVMQMRFHARELEKNFEELYDKIMAGQEGEA